MEEIRVTGRILRWGNSYGIRLRKQDLERAGIKEGEEIQVRLGTAGERHVDLSRFPLFSDDPDVAADHDRYLGEARWRDLQRKTTRR